MIGVWGEKTENIFNEIVAETFLSLGKEIEIRCRKLKGCKLS